MRVCVFMHQLAYKFLEHYYSTILEMNITIKITPNRAYHLPYFYELYWILKCGLLGNNAFENIEDEWWQYENQDIQ